MPFPDVCRSSLPSPSSDELVRLALSQLDPAHGRAPRAEASSARSEPEPSSLPHGLATGAEGTADFVAQLLEGTATGAGLEIGGGAFGAAVTLFAGWHEGDRRGTEWDSNVLRGALMALSGRMDDIPANDLTGLRDGARRIEYLSQHDPAAFDRLRTAIAGVERDGATSVYLGRDTGCAFEARYGSDLVFREGVDRARDERSDRPAAFEAHRREAQGLDAALQHGRTSGGVRG